MAYEYLVLLDNLEFDFANQWAMANKEDIPSEGWRKCADRTKLELRKAISEGAIKPVDQTFLYEVRPVDPDASVKISELVAYGIAKNLGWLCDVPAMAAAMGFTVIDTTDNQPPAAAVGAAPVVVAPASKGGTATVWTDVRKTKARDYRQQHGLKKTAEFYQVSQATISKHIPADKPQKKPLGYWSGLPMTVE